jgi:CRP-like cAMP-binding protein
VGETVGSELGAFLVAEGRQVRLAAGEYLFHEGDRSLSVYACVEGRVKISLTLPSGRELLLGMKFPGQEFGELSAIDERPRSAAASVAEPSIVATMSGPEFLARLQEHPTLALSVLRNLALQLRRANARLSAHNGDRILVRVGSRLLELTDLYRRHAGAGDRVDLPITQTDLANWIGTSRESTSRALADLRRQGVVQTGRSRITVLDVSALEGAVRAG